jgi:hypothetical protein
MLNYLIRQQLSGFIVNDLMHVNRDPSIRFRREALRLHVRIDHLELTPPVFPDATGPSTRPPSIPFGQSTSPCITASTLSISRRLNAAYAR